MVGLGNAAGFQRSTVNPKVATKKIQDDKKKKPVGKKADGNKKAAAVLAGKSGAVAKAAAAPAATPAAAAAAPAPASEAAASTSLPATAPAASNEQLRGQVCVRYNHYKDEFDVIDGRLQFEEVDRKYALSFAFKGEFSCRLQRSNGDMIDLDEPLRREMRPDPDGFGPDAEEEVVIGCFSGLDLHEPNGTPASYMMVVDEDPALAATAPKHVYRAASSSGAPSGSRGAALVTAELKQLSAEELREGGDRYRELLEARDLEDVMGGF